MTQQTHQNAGLARPRYSHDPPVYTELPSLRDWMGLATPARQTSATRTSDPRPTAAPPGRPTHSAANPARQPTAPVIRPPARPGVDTQLPGAGPGYYSYSAPGRRYGRSEIIRALQAVGVAWHRSHPQGPRIGFGDISLRGGGPIPPHSSHRDGVDVDIRPLRNDGREQAARHDLPSYSRALTQQLVDYLRGSSGLTVRFILFNDAGITGVRRWAGHDNHLHVRFSITPGTPARSAGSPGASSAQPAAPTVVTPSAPPAAPVTPSASPLPPVGHARPTVAPTRLGILVARGGSAEEFRYGFTTEDLLWTARLLAGEAGGTDDPASRAVIWAMLNRYGLLAHPHYASFHQFLRRYSTPLQPVLRNWRAARRHMADPDFVRTGGDYPTTGRDPAPPGIPRGQLRRFISLQRTPWERLPAAARNLAVAVLSGRVTNPIGPATEFADTRAHFRDRHGRLPSAEEWRRFTLEYARRGGLAWIGDRPGLDQRSNAFFVKRRLAGLPADSVRVQAAP